MNSSQSAAQLQAFFHREIPLTAAMGLAVAELSECSIELVAPLAPNRNDKQTAFGGSLASFLTLAGWGLVHSRLQAAHLAADIVIHKSDIVYHRPIVSDISVRCDLPEQPEWTQFVDRLRRRQRSRIELRGWVAGESGPAVTMDGRYVAIAR